jgi:hypothetical protein
MKKSKIKSSEVTKAERADQKPQKETELAALKGQLKIEASLEKVRAQALGMKKLTTC